MREAKHYTESFYDDHQSGSYSSAKKVLPVVYNLFRPQSVIDIGCGIGDWLKVWSDILGVPYIMGVEGPYVNPDKLRVPKENVRFQDLKENFNIAKKFDLAMSLEVAEHLPESNAENFIRNLTGLSDVILFSAAIPGQRGTYHINEQEPEYWAEIFLKFDYVAVDFLRENIWKDTDIEWWYRQNIMIYIKKSRIQEFPDLYEAYKNTSQNLYKIHPELFRHVSQELTKISSINGFIRWKLYPLKQFLKKKFGGK